MATIESHLYQFKPLKNPHSIRLVKIKLGEFKDDIECSIHHIDLDSEDEPGYVALSYRWGDVKDPRNVATITCDGQKVSISRNLQDALRRLRRKREWCTMWADALCINQAQTKEGLAEKSRQVQLMSMIFSKAKKVIVDLGNADEQTMLGVELMRQMTSIPLEKIGPHFVFQPMYTDLGLPPLSDPKWQAWTDISSREWFNRVWMVQEFALARDLEVMIGPCIFNGSLLEKAHRISTGFQPSMDSLLNTLVKPEKSMRGIAVMVLVRTMYREKASLRLADLFGMCSSFQATDIRDHLYALIGLLKDDAPDGESAQTLQQAFPVDYQENQHDLAVRFARYLAARRPPSLVWVYANGPHPDQPSWAPNLDTNSLRMTAEGVLPHTEERPLFCAGGGGGGVYDFSARLSSGKSMLKCKGYIVDCIKDVTDVFDMTSDQVEQNRNSIGEMGVGIVNFEQSARQMLEKNGFGHPFIETREDVDEAYLRTLISDTDANQTSRASPQMDKSFRAFAAVSNMVASGGGRDDIDHNPAELARVVQLTPYMLAFTSAMFKRRVCVTENGRVGNVVAGCRTGDCIAVVEGVERPLTLREASEAGCYQYIGLAYVHGIMDGEAISGKAVVSDEIRIV